MRKHLQVAIGQHSSKGAKPINQDFHGVFIPNEPILNSKGIVVALADGISSSDVAKLQVKRPLRDLFKITTVRQMRGQ